MGGAGSSLASWKTVGMKDGFCSSCLNWRTIEITGDYHTGKVALGITDLAGSTLGFSAREKNEGL